MSRLDSAIRRLEAQRACLDRAAELLDGVPGHVFELGLGNGRTYDHLRERFPSREIFVFEMKISAHPSCIPDDDHLFLGDVLDRLPAVTEGGSASFTLTAAPAPAGSPAPSSASRAAQKRSGAACTRLVTTCSGSMRRGCSATCT